MNKEARKIQERYEEFASAFLHPLLNGGFVQTGKPLSPGMLEHFALTRPSDTNVDREIYDQIHGAAGEIAPVDNLRWPDRGALGLAMAGHNMAAATDPELDRAFARSGRTRMLEWADWLIEQAGPPTTRGSAIARHVIVERLLALKRRDTTASNWGYVHAYPGRPMPTGVLTKPRWVDVSKEDVPILRLWEETDEDAPMSPRLVELLRRSPITHLLRTDLVPSVTVGTAMLAVLSDDVMRHGIARALVQRGHAVAAPLGGALANLANAEPPPSMLYYFLALVYEVHVIAILDALSGKKAIFDRAETMDEAIFYAVLPAMVGAPDDLYGLLDLDPDDLALVRKEAGRLDTVAGAEAGSYVVSLIDYATPPRLDHERDPVEVPA